MDNSFKNLIDSAQEVLILLPSKPFMDQVAGGLSLYLSLAGSGKNVSISCPSPMITEFNRLIGIDKIVAEVGNKNLTIKLVNYDAQNVDKVSYDIDNGQFKLTVAPKAGLTSPTKEQIDISYSGVSADTVILVGGANESHFPTLQNPDIKSAKFVHIGTRLLEVTSDLQILSFAKPASSTSELVASLIKEGGFVVEEDIATNLLAGIEEQSKNFQGEGVGPDTFMIFAELLKLGGRRTPKVMPARSYPQGSIPNKPFTSPVQGTVDKFMNGVPAPLTQDRQMTPEEAEEELNQEIPPSWSEPKIYTGTTVS